ncbi:MAG: hypothetical protein AABP62_05120 [Planctomycetota bacterium]
MPPTTLEDRVTTVEQELSVVESELIEVKRQLAAVLSGEPPARTGWLKHVIGSMSDFPEFAEVVRLGREYRQSYRAPGDEDL